MRQLQQGQWVAPGLGDDPIDHLFIEAPADHRSEQAARVLIAQSANHQPGQPGKGLILARFAPRKGELCIRLHACGARQLTARRPFGQVLEQRGLADSRLSAENEDSAPPRPSAVQQSVQRLLLVATPDQTDGPGAASSATVLHRYLSRHIKTAPARPAACRDSARGSGPASPASRDPTGTRRTVAPPVEAPPTAAAAGLR